jgi:hypothetical protein
MDYQAFTNDSLTMMYAAVRGALAADDAAERQGGEPPFKVRDTPEWKKHAADLESEMLRRGMLFEIIDWAEGQGSLPLSSSESPRVGPASIGHQHEVPRKITIVSGTCGFTIHAVFWWSWDGTAWNGECGFVLGEAVADPAPAAAFFTGSLALFAR